MVGDIRADRAIVMGDSIRVLMKCKSQNGERNAYEQEIDKLSLHGIMINQNERKVNGVCTVFFGKRYPILKHTWRHLGCLRPSPCQTEKSRAERERPSKSLTTIRRNEDLSPTAFRIAELN
jgi:hypothetical protein